MSPGHANPQGAGRSVQADGARASEERVQESNIAIEHRECAAKNMRAGDWHTGKKQCAANGRVA